MFSVLLSGVLLQRRYDTFVSAVKDRSRAFMSALDAEVNGHLTTLQALAVLPSLQERVRDSGIGFTPEAGFDVRKKYDGASALAEGPGRPPPGSSR